MKNTDEMNLTPIDGHTLKRVEELWMERMIKLGIKPLSKKGVELECEFFVGAMCALRAMGYADPPRWLLPIMCGRSVTAEVRKYHE